MIRYSRRWTWLFYGLAVLVLAAGAIAGLLVWRTRSSETREVLDIAAVKEAAENILSNTVFITDSWLDGPLPNDIDTLVIDQQESLALLSGEIARTHDLIEQVQTLREGGDTELPAEAEQALASLASAQSLLEEALNQIGALLNGLQPIDVAEAAYRKGYDALTSAIASHNQAIAAGSSTFAATRQEASSAVSSLEEAEAAIASAGIEGLDTGGAASAVDGLKNTALLFIEACRKGEANDIEGHNGAMVEVQSMLSASPLSILDLIDIGGWLRPRIDAYLEPVTQELDECNDLLATLPPYLRRNGRG
jgi:hypothetical protein